MALKGLSKRWIVGIVLSILRPLLALTTPKIEKAMEDGVRNLYAKAVETENPWDDMAVEFIADLLDVELG